MLFYISCFLTGDAGQLPCYPKDRQRERRIGRPGWDLESGFIASFLLETLFYQGHGIVDYFKKHDIPVLAPEELRLHIGSP
jgi:hypothetical protein